MRETLKRIFRFAIPLVGPGRGRSMAMVRAVGLTAAGLALCLAAPAGAQAGPDDTVAGVVTARSEGTTSLIVTMPYTGDANANNTVTVEYKLCTDVTYSSTSATHSASPYVVAINSLTANACYDLRAAYNEAGPDVVSGTNPQNIRISTTWDTTMLHNRNRFPGSTKWDANGGWGMPGTKYGQFTCETCHTKGPANIKRIKEAITTPDATNWASSGSSSVTVNFQSTTTPNGFGDDAGGHTTSQKVCEVCHSQNKYHNYDTADNTGGTAHNNGTDCMQCHPHSVGFIGKGDCISCHAATPSVFWSRNSAPGAHATHYGEDAWNLAAYDDSNLSQSGFYKYNCQKCHESGHSASPTPNITLSSTNAPPSSGGSFESTGKTCSTVYCHSNGLGSYPGTAAKWTDAATGDCGTCHGATYAAPPSSGSHTAHVGTGSGLQLNCSKCHNQIASVGTVADMQKHVNYAADWNLDQTDNRIKDTLYTITGSYSAVDAGSFGSKTPPSTTYGNCSNIYCHSIVQTSSGGVLTGAVGEYKTPTWGTASTGQCGTCHQGDGTGSGTTIATGSHPMHVTTYSYACTRCHNTTASQHADRSINLAFNLPYDFGATEGYTQGLTHNPGNGYGSCSNMYCHSIVQTTAGASLTGAVGEYKSVAWNTDNGTIGCASCHGNPSASGGHLKHAGTGAGQYGFTCAQCHSGQVPPSVTTHTDGSINTAIASTWSGSYSGDTIPGGSSYSTCANTYCHSKGTSVSTGTILANTSANWGTAGPLGCTSCHGNEAGNDGSGRPYYTSGTPNKTNSHVAHGSQSCNGCHYTTTSTGSSITGISNHVNKSYTVNNSDTADTISYTFATTGGTCSGTFGCHEASTWGGPSKNCISCHSQGLGDRRQITATGTQPDGTGGTTGGDFVRASRHVSNGTTTQIVRHWDCVVCHLEGQATGTPGRTSTDHGGTPSGKADVNLRNVDNYTTGWAWNRFGTITTAMRDNLDSFCMGCHDSDTSYTTAAPYYVPESGDGRIIYTQGTGATAPRSTVYVARSDSFNASMNGSQGDEDKSTGVANPAAAPLQTVLRASPTNKNEMIAGYVTSGGVLEVLCYNNGAWTKDFTVTVGGTGTTRRFDIAYETQSGDAIVLYSTNAAATNELAYRTKLGSASCGSANWSGATNYDVARTTGIVQWVRLESDPVSTSNVVAAAWADANSDLSAAKWSGTAWGAEPTAALETALQIVSTAQDVESFDIAFESLTGDLMIAWSREGNANIWYSTSGAGTNTYAAAASLAAAEFQHVDLSADPATDQILFAGLSAANFRGVTWSGTGWNTVTSLDTSNATPTAGGKMVASGWLNNGATKRGIIVYHDSGAGNIGWYAVTYPDTFTLQTDVAQDGGVWGAQTQYDIQMDPINKDRLMLLVSDASSDLSAKRLVLESVGTLQWTSSDDGAIETTTSTTAYKSWAFAYQRKVSSGTRGGGASSIAVNSTNDGLLTGSTASPVARRYTPFNTSDSLMPYWEYLAGTPPVPEGQLINERLRRGRAQRSDETASNTDIRGYLVDVKGQFNYRNLTGKQWGSHHNLNQFTKRYTNTSGYPAAAAWEVYLTKENVNLNTGNWASAGLHCSDCHLNEVNAHGASSAWYMVTDRSNSDARATATGTQSGTDFCFKCHARATYGEANSSTASRTQYHDQNGGDCSNIQGDTTYTGDVIAFMGSGGGGVTASEQFPCFGCHAGRDFGEIHGMNKRYRIGAGATDTIPGPLMKRYRFMSGASMRYYSPTGTDTVADPGGWEGTSTPGCYTVSNNTIGLPDTTWGSCNNHAGSYQPGNAPNGSRLLEH